LPEKIGLSRSMLRQQCSNTRNNRHGACTVVLCLSLSNLWEHAPRQLHHPLPRGASDADTIGLCGIKNFKYV